MHAECDYVICRDYDFSAKQMYFEIKVTKSKNREGAFGKQLESFTKSINRGSNALKKKFKGLKAWASQSRLDGLLTVTKQSN